MRALLLFLISAPATIPVHATAYHLILSGAGGEKEYTEKFAGWGNRLANVIIQSTGAAEDHVTLFTADGTSKTPAISADIIATAIGELKGRVTDHDDLYIYLIGHGGYLKNESRFNLPGPDLTANAFKDLLSAAPARRVIVVDSTSSSSGFINVLSGQDRIIATATKSVDEVNAPEFMEYFIQGLEDSSADRDHDDRISILEACETAADLTAAFYLGSGFISTEHAILDDNGDGLGSRLPIPEDADAVFAQTKPADAPKDNVFDGTIAAKTYLKDFSFPASVPQELVDAYLVAIDEIEALKAAKPGMTSDEYSAQFETLIIKAARINRDIRSHAGDNS